MNGILNKRGQVILTRMETGLIAIVMATSLVMVAMIWQYLSGAEVQYSIVWSVFVIICVVALSVFLVVGKYSTEHDKIRHGR